MTDSAHPLVDLGGNESPLGPSPLVREAILAELDRLHRYPPMQDDELREALAAHHGRGLTRDHFLTGAAGSEVIDLVSRAFLEPGDEIIISTPTFTAYAPAAALAGAGVVDVPLKPGDFSLDVERLLAAVTPRTRLLYLCNPGNPTGVIATRDDVARLLGALPPHVLLVSDEVYSHYVDDPAFPDTTIDVLAGRSVIVIHSFSKVHGLAGLRLGYAFAAPAIIARVARFRRAYHLSRLALAAGIAALRDAAHIERTIDLARRGRRFLYDGIAAMGIEVWESQANFVLVRPPDGEGMVRTLAAHGIRVRSTARNGFPGGIRVTAGLEDENRRFLSAFADALDRAQSATDRR